ncbi:uncharacterized protein isoform X3 [Rhodnius prolixus]|uniref:uncharacterized protein isoform X3 n=1 Tax=Rhodnius prolixus TaxID=13249 RepID=UPI003D18FA99
MAKPNPVWSQFGAANSVCKTGSMCNNHYPAQSSQVHQTSNLSSVYGMFYDQNLRQEPSRTSSGHIGNGSHYLASQQVGLAGSMPLSQQSYVGLPFSAYSLPLPHNFIHRPVAHVDPQNYQYFAGSHSYGSSTSRRVTPYQRGVRPDRRRAQESVRRGFELIRPEMENSRRNVPLRNMLEPVASLSTTGMPQSSVVSVGAANESMTVRQFLSSWRDRDEELPERTAVVGHTESYLSSLTQASPSLNAPPTQAEASSFMGASAQEGGWAGEERRIERISNPDMIPLMYPIPQMQPSHLTQTESVAQISQAHLNHSAGLPPTPWQCLDLQGQQCYGGPPASTDYRAEEARPSLQPQRHYNINSSIETGEIFDDINGTRESRHRSSSSSLQSHALSNRSNNVFPSDERLWESALHPPQNLNYPTMSSEGVGSHGLLNVGYYDSLVADAGSLVGSSLRAEPTPPPAHPDTTTRDPQESAEQVSTSQHLNLALTQPATTPQLCFPQNNNDCQNEGNNPLNVCHGNEDTVNKIDEEFVKNDIIESTLQDTIIKEDLQLDNNENTKIKNNNNIIIENNNTVDKVGIVSSPTDLRADITGTDSTHHRSEAIAKLAVNQDNRAQALPYSEHAQSYQSIASPQMMLPCDGCCQDISSEVGEDGSFEEKLQEKVSLKASEYPMKEDVHDDFNLIEQSESENVVEGMSSTSPHDSNQSTTDFPSDKEGIGNDQLEETLWSATNPTGAPATATSPRKKHKPKQSIYCSLLWRRIFDESPVKLDLGRAKVQVKFDPAIKEWRIVKPEGKQQDGPLHQHYSVLIHFKSYLHFVFIAWIRLYIQINTTPRQMIELCESAGDVDVKEEREDEAYKRLERNAVQFWSQDTLPSLPSKVDQRTCSPGSSRAASLSVSKTLLTVSHLIVKNDVTPIPNLVIKRTNTAYMSYLKNVTAKQDNFLAYLRKTEKYKLNNNGFTAKTRSIDDISVKGNQQNATTQDCNRDDSNDEKVDVEIHHCLLCGQSYLSKEEMFRHDRSAGHRRLELVQRRAHHRAYQRATGSYDPTVPTLTPKDHEFLVHLPHVPGFRNYYHHSSHFTDLD